MNLYERLIENPLFFKWIYHSTKEIESYWESYLKLNPGEAKEIKHFKNQFDHYLSYSTEELSQAKKHALAQRIIKKLEQVDDKKGKSIALKQLLRYAAVGLLFFVIGGGLIYLYLGDRHPTFYVENPVVSSNIHEPVLIIDNQQEIQLNGNKPELDYSGDKDIILNNTEKIEKRGGTNIPEINTLVVPYGSRSTITLADGSKVWLNAGSRLIYPSNFIDDRREVFLIGEAFFDVNRNEEKPFIINTSEIEIEVLGTRFNVSAYPEDGSVQTALEEGSVEINYINATIFDRGVLLKPGQLASFSKQKKETNVTNVDIRDYTLWTDGLFSFSGSDLGRIVKKLERYYNIQIRYRDPMNATIRISGKLDITKSSDEVLGYLSQITDLEFSKLNNWQYEIR